MFDHDSLMIGKKWPWKVHLGCELRMGQALKRPTIERRTRLDWRHRGSKHTCQSEFLPYHMLLKMWWSKYSDSDLNLGYLVQCISSRP